MLKKTLPTWGGYRDKYAGIKRALKITLFRMWAAGAVCFFAAWGRAGPREADELFSLSLILSLILVMVLCDIIIVNPVIRLASGKRILGDEPLGWRLFVKRPLHIVKVVLLIILIVHTYYFLNVVSIRAFGLDQDAVPVPLEPILFGTLYGLYYLFFDLLLKHTLGRLFPTLFVKEQT